MAKKKLLSLNDLYDFYVSQNKNVKFSSEDNNTKIVVHIDELCRFEEEKDTDLNLKTYLRFCHTKDNVNKSFIPKKSMEDAMSTAYNMPILGFIYKNDKGDYVFAGHEFYEDDNGEIVYEEVPVGVVPESAGLKLVYDEEEDKHYLEGYGLIWKTYSHAAEILKRESKLSVSIEIEVDELSYNAAEKILQIDKFRFCGVTILQENRYTGEEIKPGMRGAEIKIEDFSAENNSIFSNELINELKKFNENFKTLNLNNKQGGQEMNLFEKLLAKYSITVEDVKFEYENLSDEELEKAFAEAFGDTEDDVEDTTEQTDNDTNVEDNAEGSEEGDGNVEDNADTNADDGENDNETYSLTLPDGTVKNFSLSLNDIEGALNELVNEAYSELDNDYYSTIVYPDEGKVVMCAWFSNNCYRQAYKRKKDTFSLDGERVAVHSIFVSDDEQKLLDDMKSNYSAMETKLSNYESEPEKIKVLESEDYNGIKSTDEYAELSKRENYFELSKDEIASKLDEIVLSYAKKNALKFSANENKPRVRKVPVHTESVVNNYGSLLKDI